MPISKLQGVPASARWTLKAKSINTTAQLLAAAGRVEPREALATEARIALELLTALVQRADLARIDGIGVKFAQMLEEIGIHDVAAVADQGPVRLHDSLCHYNEQTRLCRRSPTLAEATYWVEQARALPIVVYYRRPDVEPVSAKSHP